MSRLFWTVLSALVILLIGADSLLAQDTWPSFPSGSGGEHSILRGPGYYVALYKILLLLAAVWGWAFTTNWLGKDAEELGDATGVRHEIWTPVVIFTFFFGFVVLALGIPIFFVGYITLLLTWFVPLGIYCGLRNAKVGPDQKVGTPSHLKRWMASLGKNKKKTDAPRNAYELGAPVDIVGVDGDASTNQANLIVARNTLAFVPMKELLADGLNNRATKILIDYLPDSASVKYFVDGVWHNGDPRVWEKGPFNREIGDAILWILKKITNLNSNERRMRQEGRFKLEYLGMKSTGSLMSQGTQQGERALLTFVPVLKNPPLIDQLGMREKMREDLKGLLSKPGLFIVSSLPGDGLSATWIGILKGADRLLHDYVAVEDALKPEPDLENVDVTRFKSANGETATSVLKKIVLKQPEVYILPEIAEGEAIDVVCNEIEQEDRRAIVSVRAKEAVEALLRVLSLKPNPEKFAKNVVGVLNQRLVRRLCEHCREPVQATPELLQRLGIPAGRVDVLYRERQPPQPGQPVQRRKGEPEICPHCRGIGFAGRTAIFELLTMNDKLREALIKQPRLETLRNVAKMTGQHDLQQEGVLLVALGVTSISELQRVLKQ